MGGEVKVHLLVGWSGAGHEWANTRCGRRGVIAGSWGDGVAEFDDAACRRFDATHNHKLVTCKRCGSAKEAA